MVGGRRRWGQDGTGKGLKKDFMRANDTGKEEEEEGECRKEGGKARVWKGVEAG